MTDQNDSITCIQKEEEEAKLKLIEKTKANGKDLSTKREEYEEKLSELQDNLKNEGMEELNKAKNEAAEDYKKKTEAAQRRRENEIRDASNRADQAVSLIEKTFLDFVKK